MGISWFFVRAEPLRDDAGKVVRWYATSTDIEDRKQAEFKMSGSEAKRGIENPSRNAKFPFMQKLFILI